MKKYLFLFALSFIVIGSYAQEYKDMRKGMNEIVIKTDKTPEEAFKSWGRHLAQNGFGIEHSDANFLSISTKPKDTSKMNYDFFINTIIGDNGDIIVTMKWRLKSSWLAGTNATEFYDWELTSYKRDIFYIDFMDMAKKYGEYEIVYNFK